jgi:acyl-coenzyme A thioesterase PaaI-like protein
MCMNTGLASDQDVRFHEGLCQGGHSTTVLDSIGGCNNPIITPPGNSDNHRQDNKGRQQMPYP